jgi:hypothetical protein
MTRLRSLPRLLLALVGLLAAAGGHALAFTVTGGWTLPVGSAQLAGQAGSDFIPEQSSAANAVVIDVTGALLDTEPWFITVHRTDVLWDPTLTLSTRRTSEGVGGGTISGGSAYQTITLVAQSFFQGTGNRSSIQVQLRLGGISVTIGARALFTQVVLTLLDS